jgi:hypothetical protein
LTIDAPWLLPIHSVPGLFESTDLDGHVIKPSKLQQIPVKVVRK